MINITRGVLVVIGVRGSRYTVRCTCGNVFETWKSRFENYSGKACRVCKTRGENNGRYKGGGHVENKLEYNSWRAMRERCNNPKYRRYDRYGGRGIKVCEEWDNRDGFTSFLTDMGKKPSPKHTIDRIDNDGDYTPENCRWANQYEQILNSTGVKLITVDGVTDTVINQCRRFGIPRNLYENRVKLGWSIEDAFKIPSQGLGSNQVTYRKS